MNRHSVACTCSPVCRDRHARYERGRDHDARHGRQRIIDGTGTRRRLQALMAAGWTCQQIAAAHPGWTPGKAGRDAVQKLVEQQRVRRTIADRVAVVYAQLEDLDGDSVQTRARALARGWAPPEAWWPEDLDDPEAQPWARTGGLDEVLLQRMRAGRATAAELAELRHLHWSVRLPLIDRWQAAGRSLAQLERAGWNPHRDRKLYAGRLAA